MNENNIFCSECGAVLNEEERYIHLKVIRCVRNVLTAVPLPVIAAATGFGEIMQRLILTIHYARIAMNTATPLVRIAEDLYIMKTHIMRTAKIIRTAENVLKS